MPPIRRITFAVLVPLLVASACSPDQSEELAQLRARVAELEAMVGPPPASLDQFYPPEAEGPVLT